MDVKYTFTADIAGTNRETTELSVSRTPTRQNSAGMAPYFAYFAVWLFSLC